MRAATRQGRPLTRRGATPLGAAPRPSDSVIPPAGRAHAPYAICQAAPVVASTQTVYHSP